MTSLADLQPGWYEFHALPVNTTHVAYVYGDGSVYLPEGPDVTDEMEFRWAVENGDAFRLVRVDELTSPDGSAA